MLCRTHCRRNSGVVTMMIFALAYGMHTLGRSRRSCGSAFVQTAQWQPIIGTPALVPVPRNNSSSSGICDVYRAAGLQRKIGPARKLICHVHDCVVNSGALSHSRPFIALFVLTIV